MGSRRRSRSRSIPTQVHVPCGGMGTETAIALAHEAVQPFSWPVLHESSPNYPDAQTSTTATRPCSVGSSRADTNLSAQQQFADEFFARDVCQGRVRLSVVVAASSGWRVSIFSFECGGQTYQGRYDMCQDFSSLHLACGLPHQWANPHPDDRSGEGSVSSSWRQWQAPRPRSAFQSPSKLFVREPVVVPVAALAAMSHGGAVGRRILEDHQLCR